MDACGVTDTRSDDPDIESSIAWLGALLAAIGCIVIAIAGFVIAPPGGGIFGALGMPGAVILAYRFAPAIARTDRRSACGLAGRMATESILVADALVVVAVAFVVCNNGLGSLARGEIDSSPLLLVADVMALVLIGGLVFIIGAIVIGLPAAVIVLPTTLIWAALLRLIVGRDRIPT